MNGYPKKPSTLDKGWIWCSIDRVIESSGVRANELSWCCEALGSDNEIHGRNLPRELALDWWTDTDQSVEATVVLRLENWRGEVALRKVVVGPEVVARDD